MVEIPKFQLYGENNPDIQEQIQKTLKLREWNVLTTSERETIISEMKRHGYISVDNPGMVSAIDKLNEKYLRILPGKELHRTLSKFNHPENRPISNLIIDAMEREAASIDFENILCSSDNNPLVYSAISFLCKEYIDDSCLYDQLPNGENEITDESPRSAYEEFDELSGTLNHIFEQFSINIVITRAGLFPRQDENISKRIYIPVMDILSHPKYEKINNDLSDIIESYDERKYPDVITRCHRLVHRFLKIQLHSDGASGKGEFGALFSEAKKSGIIPSNRFSEGIIEATKKHLSSERVLKGTAKPDTESASFSDALLIMNSTMIFLQFCLQTKP